MIRSLARTLEIEGPHGDQAPAAPGFQEALVLAATLPTMTVAPLERRPTATEPPAPPPVISMPVAGIEAASDPSHIELVLDDQGEQLVVSVTVRGSDVRVQLQTSEPTMLAAARNAAALDHALRADGLELVELELQADSSDYLADSSDGSETDQEEPQS